MSKLEQLMADIKALEQELLDELQQKQDEYFYVIRNKKVQFEEETRQYHRELATRLRVYIAHARLPVLLTVPIIWACLLPALLLDLVVSVYHSVCFRVYRIPRVRRSDYIVIDRHSLQYLNAIEKLNCIYCGYFNGLIAWVQEVAARTEQYWCPIKHARRVGSIHSRYHKFFEYGDGDRYRESLDQRRGEFDDVKGRP